MHEYRTTPSLRLPSRGCPIFMHLYCWVLQTIDLFGLTFNQGSNCRAFALLGHSSLLYITWERVVRFLLRLSMRLRVWFWSFDGWLTQYMLLCWSYISLGKHIISLPILLLSIVTSHNITVDMTAYWLACQLADTAQYASTKGTSVCREWCSMLYSERANPAKVHYLINVRSDWHNVRNCERRCRPTGDVNDYFQVRQRLCHKEVFSTPLQIVNRGKQVW